MHVQEHGVERIMKTSGQTSTCLAIYPSSLILYDESAIVGLYCKLPKIARRISTVFRSLETRICQKIYSNKIHDERIVIHLQSSLRSLKPRDKSLRYCVQYKDGFVNNYLQQWDPLCITETNSIQAWCCPFIIIDVASSATSATMRPTRERIITHSHSALIASNTVNSQTRCRQ